MTENTLSSELNSAADHRSKTPAQAIDFSRAGVMRNFGWNMALMARILTRNGATGADVCDEGCNAGLAELGSGCVKAASVAKPSPEIENIRRTSSLESHLLAENPHDPSSGLRAGNVRPTVDLGSNTNTCGNSSGDEVGAEDDT